MTASGLTVQDLAAYRVLKKEHHKAPGWVIFPTYDFAVSPPVL